MQACSGAVGVVMVVADRNVNGIGCGPRDAERGHGRRRAAGWHDGSRAKLLRIASRSVGQGNVLGEDRDRCRASRSAAGRGIVITPTTQYGGTDSQEYENPQVKGLSSKHPQSLHWRELNCQTLTSSDSDSKSGFQESSSGVQCSISSQDACISGTWSMPWPWEQTSSVPHQSRSRQAGAPT